MGKTSLGMNIVENVLINKDIKGGVLVFSLEMSAESLTIRLLASNAKVDQQKVRSASMNQDELKKFIECSSKLRDLPLYVDDSSMLSPMELRARARRIHRQEPNGLSLIIVDYLQLMQIPGSTENRVNQISEISRSLKMLAKELKVPVIAISQLNRAVEQRPNKKPVMSDLRDSGALEQDADVILFIYRDEAYDEDSQQGNKVEINISKQRNGPTGTVLLTFLKEYTRFEDFAVDSYYDSIQ
jgi:replicative DNA helicase